jgi:DNA-binding transcriptional LysR family regulator
VSVYELPAASRFSTAIELRLLRYFVAVALERNMTRAAQRLGISQQALSVAIRKLEDELQTRLLSRSTSGVELTDAGAALLEDAPRGIRLIEEACDRAMAVGHGSRAPVRLGYGWTEGESTVSRLRCEMQNDAQALQWVARSLPRQAILRELTSGSIDAAILTEPDLDDSLSAVLLRREPLVVALGRRHPLAGSREPVAADAFSSSPLALVPRQDAPALHDALLARCADRDVAPQTVELRFAGREAEAAAALYDSAWAMLAPASGSAFLRSWGLTVRPLNDPLYLSVHVVWSTAASAELLPFVRATRAAARQLGWLSPVAPQTGITLLSVPAADAERAELVQLV